MKKLKQRADGRYVRSIKIGAKPDGSPDRKFVYGYSPKEVDDKYIALSNSLKTGVYVDDEGMTIGEWADAWKTIYKSDREYNTRAMYDNAINTHIKKNIGYLRLRDAKQYHIRAFLSKLKDGGHHRTAAICRMTLVQLFDDAMENDLVAKNPVRSIKLAKSPKPKGRFLSRIEVDMLGKSDLTIREQAFLLFGMDSGLRMGEIMAVCKSDIDLYNKTVSIEKVVVFEPNKGTIKPYPKTDESIREAPIFAPLENALLKYMPTVIGDRLFTTGKGETMSKSSFRRMWESIEKKMTIAAARHETSLKDGKITSHMLRHTFATKCYYAGVDLLQAKKWMGHKDIKMLMEVYTHLDKEEEPNAREKFKNYSYGVKKESKIEWPTV